MSENPWNVPNALALFRLVGSAVLAGVALGGDPRPFAWLLLALLISDWLDGKLAIWWNQRTIFGARLDSMADAAMYAALLFGLIWLEWDFVRREKVWIAAALFSYALTTLIGLARYRRIPSYHTRLAKTSWLLVGIAAVVLFANGPAWTARLAMAVVTATNLEATLMTCILPEWRANVPSLLHAWRLRQHSTPAAHQGLHDEGEEAQQSQRQQDIPGQQRPDSVFNQPSQARQTGAQEDEHGVTRK
jgi:CDP-diacylglycerol--glycerol-3-phosphate 3-phosphatidyltransferase